jgi:hypothetical protein
MKANLILFELYLRFECDKSLLVGVDVVDSWLVNVAVFLNCKIGRIPFLYLRLPVSTGNAHRHSFSIPLVEKIRSKLYNWKSRNISMGGRLVMLQSFLSSISVCLFYFLLQGSDNYHLFIESIFKAFLWGGSEESSKFN